MTHVPAASGDHGPCTCGFRFGASMGHSLGCPAFVLPEKRGDSGYCTCEHSHRSALCPLHGEALVAEVAAEQERRCKACGWEQSHVRHADPNLYNFHEFAFHNGGGPDAH